MRALILTLVLGYAVLAQGPTPCHDYDMPKGEKANCHCVLVPDDDGRCVVRHDSEGSATRCAHDCEEQKYCMCHPDECEWSQGPRMNDFKMQHMRAR